MTEYIAPAPHHELRQAIALLKMYHDATPSLSDEQAMDLLAKITEQLMVQLLAQQKRIAVLEAEVAQLQIEKARS